MELLEPRLMLLPPAAKTSEPSASWDYVARGRAAPAGVPDPELVERAKRRWLTATYKLEILAEADACTAPGEIGELLRREGLYTSALDVLAQAAQGRRAEGARPPARAQACRSA